MRASRFRRFRKFACSDRRSSHTSRHARTHLCGGKDSANDTCGELDCTSQDTWCVQKPLPVLGSPETFNSPQLLRQQSTLCGEGQESLESFNSPQAAEAAVYTLGRGAGTWYTHGAGYLTHTGQYLFRRSADSADVTHMLSEQPTRNENMFDHLVK